MSHKLYSPTLAKNTESLLLSVEEAKIQWDAGSYEYVHTFPDVDSVIRSTDSISDYEIVVNDRGSVFVKMFPDFICIASA